MNADGGNRSSSDSCRTSVRSSSSTVANLCSPSCERRERGGLRGTVREEGERRRDRGRENGTVREEGERRREGGRENGTVREEGERRSKR